MAQPKHIHLPLIAFILLTLAGCQSLPVQTENTTHSTTNHTQQTAQTKPTPPKQTPPPSPKPVSLASKPLTPKPSQTPPNHQKSNKTKITPPLKTHSPQTLPKKAPEKPIAPASIWQALSPHFQLAEQYQGQYNGYLKYYLRNKAYLHRVSKRAKPYLYYILQEVKKRNMPYEIALLPAVESGFTPTAKSYQSAAGLWQFIPGTAHMYDLHKNWWYDGRLDITRSTQAALNYLNKLYQMNNNDWLLALASYNAGMGNVLKAQRKYRKRHPGKKADFWAIRKYLPKETRHYVPQLLAIAHLIKHQDQYQIALEEIPNQPFIEIIPIKQQISLKTVTDITGISNSLMKQLNPGFLRPATPPHGQHHLLLPKEKAKDFKQKLAQNQSLFKIKWAKHKVRFGESLSTIAYKYRTSIKEIKRINGLKSNLIRTGKTILIPYPKHYAHKLPKLIAKKYNGQKYFHSVKRGESLWTIANYYNISTQTLCRWNNIGIRTPLRIGQKLEIRSGRYGKKITHKLKKGESLWTVAKRYGTTSTQLAKWNRIKRSKTLQPGDQLIVWIPKPTKTKSKPIEAKNHTQPIQTKKLSS